MLAREERNDGIADQAAGGALRLADDFAPRQAPHELHFLIDVVLRRPVAEDSAEVVDFRRNEFVVLRQEANGGVLEVAFGNGNHLRRFSNLYVHAVT